VWQLDRVPAHRRFALVRRPPHLPDAAQLAPAVFPIPCFRRRAEAAAAGWASARGPAAAPRATVAEVDLSKERPRQVAPPDAVPGHGPRECEQPPPKKRAVPQATVRFARIGEARGGAGRLHDVEASQIQHQQPLARLGQHVGVARPPEHVGGCSSDEAHAPSAWWRRRGPPPSPALRSPASAPPRATSGATDCGHRMTCCHAPRPGQCQRPTG